MLAKTTSHAFLFTFLSTPPNTPQRQCIAEQQQERDNRILESPDQWQLPTQHPNFVPVNWNGHQLQLTPRMAGHLAAAQASVAQDQELHDKEMLSPSDSPKLQPQHLLNSQQEPAVGLQEQNPQFVQQNVLQQLQQGNNPQGLAQQNHVVRRHAREPHPQDPSRLWCTGNSNYKPAADFGMLRTCISCCTRAQNRRNRNANNAINIDLQQKLDTPAVQPRPAREPHPDDPSRLWCTVNSHYKPVADFGEFQTCISCRIRAQNRQNQTNMDLQQQLTEPVIQPIPLHFDVDAALSDSAVMPREKELLTGSGKSMVASMPIMDTFAILHERVPLLPEECEIVIFRRSGTTNGQQVNEDFQRVTIDWERVNRFGLDGNVQECIQTLSVEGMRTTLEEGSLQLASENPPDWAFSAGFAPNIQPQETEFEQLQ
ncbi:hypothetical protein B0H14DRAFT_2616934 [Mycena olivaceomarginata]|nr:hypothetical protein B0H14DRAFT_2616934 [Mycena olivaceomarginata]